MTEHNPFNLSDQERTAARTAEEERLAREREVSDLCWVMSNKQGRRFVWRLLEKAGVFRVSFNTNNAVMAFNEGNRNAGLQLLNDIMIACPEKHTLMLNEQKEARERDGHTAADRRNKHK